MSKAILRINEVHPWLAYAVLRKSSDVSLLRADKDEDDVAAYEQQMWGKVKLPIWGPQDASPFAPADTVSTSQNYPDDSQQVINRIALVQKQNHAAIVGMLGLRPCIFLGLIMYAIVHLGCKVFVAPLSQRACGAGPTACLGRCQPPDC